MGNGQKKYAATVGTFDGVHIGHLEVLQTLRHFAEELHLQPLAITFDRHPLETVAPDRAPLMLTPSAERDRRLRAAGVEVVELTFGKEMSMLSAEEWMKLMRNRFGVELLVIGYDNTFGHDGRLLPHARYREIGERIGIEVVEAPKIEGISSSAVRKTVAAGDMDKAAAMLGRPFSVVGEVVAGQHLGRTIGWPTANIATPPRQILPAPGVYAAEAVTESGPRIAAMVNIGHRPTVGDNLATTTEAHLIDWHGDLYGKNLEIRFISRLRNEEKFESLEMLSAQLRRDSERAKEFFRKADQRTHSYIFLQQGS